MIIEHANAKINLFLKVCERNKNGMHNLETLIAPISDLFDVLELNPRDDRDIVVEGVDFVNNSVLKAAKLFQEKYNTKGVNITVKKAIPVAAGLAGGSADSSATLRGMNKLYNIGASLDELKVLSDQLGSDNSFCLFNKAAICTGTGNELEFIDEKFSLSIILIIPSFGLSTKLVFDNWNNQTTCYDKDLFCSSLDTELLDNLIFNDLTIPACNCDGGRLKEIKDKIESLGFQCHMSGSGSTLFVIEHSKEDFEKLHQSLSNCEVKKVNVINALP